MQSMGIFVIFILNRGNNNLRAALISQSNAFQLWVNNHNLEFSAGSFYREILQCSSRLKGKNEIS